ncbi:MAG: hypothetical protein M1840_008800 [Geoglossum simile]|nr:MAG: hypothetical protein M1840_008800 [Geoglossum simile]
MNDDLLNSEFVYPQSRYSEKPLDPAVLHVGAMLSASSLGQTVIGVVRANAEEEVSKHSLNARSIAQLPNSRPCVLNAASNCPELRHQIKDGYYTHILLSPEIALSPSFIDILKTAEFQNRLILVAIDEFLIGHKIPWFGASATLDPRMLEEVKELAGFTDVEVIKMSIDRPDITFAIRKMIYPLNSLQDLRFIVLPASEVLGAVATDETARSRQRLFRIPKTAVYMDSIAGIEAAVRRVMSWLIDSGCTSAMSAPAVQAYHYELGEPDKRARSAEFVKADSTWQYSSCHRIVIATDAMGMSINNPDIRHVIQWRQPLSMCSLIQRAGRASRSPKISGHFIWLVEEALSQPPQGSVPNEALDVNLPALPSALPGQEKPRRLSTKAVKNLERRSQLPDGFWQLINSGSCIRKEILKFFSEDVSQHQQLDACCSQYSTISILWPPVPKRTLCNAKSTPWMAAAARKALLTWWESKARILFRSMDYIDPAVIMSEAIVKEIVRSAGNIDSVSTLREAAGGRRPVKLPRLKASQGTNVDEEEGVGKGEGEGAGEEEVVLRSIFLKAVDGVS